MMYTLSIVIPTYNRSANLENCLTSIENAGVGALSSVQVCVSDNASTDSTMAVVDSFQKRLPIKYRCNDKNVGLAANLLRAVELADGDFVWMIGDDDMVLEDSICVLLRTIAMYGETIDLIVGNSYVLRDDFVKRMTNKISPNDMLKNADTLSSTRAIILTPFHDILDPSVAYYFLTGIFSSVFRRSKWNESRSVVDGDNLESPQRFSNLGNTFPHVKIFARAFAASLAIYIGKPLCLFTSGAQDWSALWPLVRSVRIPEAIDEYERNGLSSTKARAYRSWAFRNAMPDLFLMLLNPSRSGVRYVRLLPYLKHSLRHWGGILSPVYAFSVPRLSRFVRRIVRSF